MRISQHSVRVFLLGLVAFYPLLKFDWSTKALIGFFSVTLLIDIFGKKLSFSKANTRKFFLLSTYFILAVLSFAYSKNTHEATIRVTQMVPLLVVPLILSFTPISFEGTAKGKLLSLFVIVNVLYTFLIFYIFIDAIKAYDYGLKEYLFNYDLFQWIVQKNDSFRTVFMHKPYFSMGFVFSAVFCLFMILNKWVGSRFLQFLYTGTFAYLSLWIFYAFSFPNIVAYFICIVWLLYQNLSKRNFTSIIFVFLISSSLLVVLKYQDKDVRRGLNFIKLISNDGESSKLNDAREEIYRTYISILRKSSFSEMLFGYGVGDVQDILNQEYKVRFQSNKVKNLKYFTEEFNNPYWFKHNLQVNPNSTLTPDQKLDADLIIANKGGEKKSHNISSKVEKSGVYTFSVFVKPNDSEMMILRLGEYHQKAIFNLKEESISQKENIINAGIQRIANGWLRCFITSDTKKGGLSIVGLSNREGDYVFKNTSKKSIYIWGAQLEEGTLSAYEKNDQELLHKTIKKELNTHNNYLYFLMASGIIGLITFLVFVGYLLRISLRSKDMLKISFCVILILNFLTENILSRQWGLFFFAFVMIVLFSNQKKGKETV